MKLISGLCAAALSGMAFAAEDAQDTIEVVGNKFFYSNSGEQFYIKGIAYQQNPATSQNGGSFVDPLADADACKRDLPYLRDLSTNLLRVYALNASASHDACMQMFAEAGIYVIADLSEPDLSINRESPTWDLDLYDRYTSVIDSMQSYSNVLGFFAGNEVTNAANNTDADVYVKAAVRDMKQYIKDQGYRAIPIGYSASDAADIRVAEADYFNCGDESERVDFYGINMYEWCGSSTYETSGYKNATENFQGLGVPLFFSEYGCNAVQPRKFEEVGTLYGDKMTDVWSGGIVYMYFEEENNYGLVSVSGSSVSTLDDFGYLSSALSTVSPSIASAGSASSSNSGVECPATGSDWAAATALPPTPDRGACECINDAAACQVKSSVDEEDYGDIFGYICGSGTIDCGGINGNGTTGKYGAFAFCDAKAKLNYVLNLYYEANSKAASNCDFSGQATVVSASTASSCAAVFSQAGAAGTGSITASVSATGSATNRDSGSGAAATQGSDSKSGSDSESGSDPKSGSATQGSDSKSDSGSNSDSNSESSHNAGANISVCGSLLGSIALVFLSVM